MNRISNDVNTTEAYTMAQNPFLGTWKLVSCEFRAVDGKVSYPYGQNAVGYIMYTDDGYMSVGLMSPTHPRFAAGDMKRGTLEEKATAADTNNAGRKLL